MENVHLGFIAKTMVSFKHILNIILSNQPPSIFFITASVTQNKLFINYLVHALGNIDRIQNCVHGYFRDYCGKVT